MGRIGKSIVALAVLVILGSLLVPVVYVIGLAGRGRTVEREIARIKQSGEPVSTADLIGQRIPDHENAALVYAKCFESLPGWQGADRSRALRGWMRLDASPDDHRFWAEVRDALRGYSGVLALAEKAAAMPQCRYPAQSGASSAEASYLGGVRRLVRLVAVQASVDARDGRMDAAVRRIALAYRIADSLASERRLQSQLTRLSAIRSASDALVRAAAFNRISEDQARTLVDAIDSVDLNMAARYALEGNRVAGIRFYRDVCQGKTPIADAEHPGMSRAFKKMCSSTIGRIWLYSDQLFYLSEMRRNLQDAERPYRWLKSRNPNSLPKPPPYALFSNLLMTRIEAIAREVDRGRCDLAGSRVFLGVLAYRDRFGRYPETLDEMSRKLSWKTPEDPFSGRAFIYRREGRGFVLYSIGDDLQDSGGKQGFRMRPGDLVWRLEK